MKYKRSTIILVFIAISYLANSQSTYQKRIGINGVTSSNSPAARMHDLIRTKDGGIAMVGDATTTGIGCALIKIDKLGAVAWGKTYGQGPNQILGTLASKVVQAHDGGYYILGQFDDQQLLKFYSEGFYIVKTDSLGVLKWAKKIGGTNVGQELPQDIQLTKNGGIICVGTTTSYGQGGVSPQFGLRPVPYDIYLLKLDSLGVMSWRKTYGNVDLYDAGYAVRETLDGGYIIAGTTQVGPIKDISSNQQGVLLKTNDKGVVQWKKKYDTDFAKTLKIGTGFSAIELTSDSGFIVSGTTNVTDNNNYGPLLLVKTDKKGDIVWQKAYRFPTLTYGILTASSITTHPSPDGGYIVGMSTSTFYSKRGTIAFPTLLKTDSLGTPTWSKMYSSRGLESMIIDNDSGYLFVSNDYFEEGDKWHPFTIHKTDKNGDMGSCQANILVNSYTVSLPVSNWDAFTSTGGSLINTGSEITISLFDTVTNCSGSVVLASFYQTGLCLSDSVIFENGSTGNLFKWNFGDPASGSSDTSTLPLPKHKYSVAGTYTVVLIASDNTTGATDTTTQPVTVFEGVVDKTIPYSGNYCTSTPNLVLDTTLGGYFNYYPEGLSIVDGSKGEIDFSNSIVGNYTVVYTNQYCRKPDTINISVRQAPNSKFSYASPVYCLLDNNPLPTLNSGAVLGVFSATPKGLVFKNTLIGEVDLAASTAGSYKITNTVNDTINFPVCPLSASVFYISLANCKTCNIAIAASSTNVACDNSNSATATAIVTGGTGSYQYLWNTDPVQTSNVAKQLAAGSYIVTVTDVGIIADTTQLVTNGSFSEGNKGFYSSYEYKESADVKGQYNVASSVLNFNQSAQLSDYFPLYSNGGNTNGNDKKFMMVAGNPIANALVWCDTINVTPSTTYLFSAWLSSLYTLSPAELVLTVNGNAISNEFKAPAITTVWEQISGAWNSETNTTAVFCITNQNRNAGAGNWYGLDDISVLPFTGSLTKCVQTQTVIIAFSTNNTEMIIPNAFSPNGDLINDMLCLTGDVCLQNFMFAVYDRWGNKVYETSNIKNCWDGTYKNAPTNSAVFIYHLSATLVNGEVLNQKGNISLMR